MAGQSHESTSPVTSHRYVLFSELHKVHKIEVNGHPNPMQPIPKFTANMTDISDLPNSSEILDLLVVGAGPHSLTLLARLHERCPSSLFNDNEHQRMVHWRKHKIANDCKKDRSGGCADRKIMVVDPYGSWMGKWNEQFGKFKIPYLRSPVFVHPDP